MANPRTNLLRARSIFEFFDHIRLAIISGRKSVFDLFDHIRLAIIAGRAERAVRNEELKKQAERMRIGFEGLGSSIRNTTGNYGRPGRRY